MFPALQKASVAFQLAGQLKDIWSTLDSERLDKIDTSLRKLVEVTLTDDEALNARRYFLESGDPLHQRFLGLLADPGSRATILRELKITEVASEPTAHTAGVVTKCRNCGFFQDN